MLYLDILKSNHKEAISIDIVAPCTKLLRELRLVGVHAYSCTIISLRVIREKELIFIARETLYFETLLLSSRLDFLVHF